MAPKRKRSAAALEEAPVSKRQLRSGGQLPASPTPSPPKRAVASHRVTSPQKRAAGGKKLDLIVPEEVVEGSEEDLDIVTGGRDQARLPASPLETRCLSDETNTVRVSSSTIAKDVAPMELDTTKRKPGRPRVKARSVVEEPIVLPSEADTIRISSFAVNNNVGQVGVEPVKRRGRLPKAKVDAVAPSPVQRNTCVDKGTSAKKPNKRTLGRQALDSRKSTHGAPVVEILVSTTHRTTPTTAATRANTKKSLVSYESSSSNDDDDEAPAQVMLTKMAHERMSANQIAGPSRPRRLTNRRLEKAAAPEEEGSNSSEEDVAELASGSPKKQISRAHLNHSVNIPGSLPDYLLPCFNAYRREILKSLQCPSLSLPAAAEDSINGIAVRQLAELIDGTVLRAEGNSCLLLGPRGSGKSQMVDACLEKVAAQKPIILRLSGWVQTTDRHALREIAFQLLQQTGTSLLPDSEKGQLDDAPEAEEDENPFLDSADHLAGEPTLSLPPSSHLHALIPVLLTLSRPVIVVLDAFDLFALHPRQSLLYCLLDTVQNCRASSESRGIAVIGITSRVDTVQLLEKRVKSRFSGRTIRTAPPADLQTCLTMVRNILLPSNMDDSGENAEEWNELWAASVERFLAAKNVTNLFNETFSITRDFKVITRILTACIVRLRPSQPYLSLQIISACSDMQRSRLRTTYLNKLSYPALCLLIASAHADTAGHKSFTFEMLYETFRNQVRALASAPVQVNGGNIGMMRCTREVLVGAFEELIAANIYMCVAAPSSNIAKQFTKYRCVIDQPDIKVVIEKAGNTNLKKWLTKNQ